MTDISLCIGINLVCIGITSISHVFVPIIQPCVNNSLVIGMEMLWIGSFAISLTTKIFHLWAINGNSDNCRIVSMIKSGIEVNVVGLAMRVWDICMLNVKTCPYFLDHSLVQSQYLFFLSEIISFLPLLVYLTVWNCNLLSNDNSGWVEVVAAFSWCLLCIAGIITTSASFRILLFLISMGFGAFMLWRYRNWSKVSLVSSCSITIHDSFQHQVNLLMTSRRRGLFLCLFYSFGVIEITNLILFFFNYLLSASAVLMMTVTLSSAIQLIFAHVIAYHGSELAHPTIYKLQAEEAAHADRRAFLRYVFHEVRVPVNALCMGIEVLSTQALGLSSDDAETLIMMKDATAQLDETLDDVLAIQKIEEGALKLVFKTFAWEDLLTSAVQPHLDQADAKGLRVTTFVSQETCPLVIGDKSRLKHVLTNLVSNAVKYSSCNGAIEIRVEDNGPADNVLVQSIRDRSRSISNVAPYQTASDISSIRSATDSIVADNHESHTSNIQNALFHPRKEQDNPMVRVFEISVIDSGNGIPSEDLMHLFNPFLRTKPGELKKTRGTGIGLAICKQIIDLHHGDIRCESVIGVGSTFIIRIPLEIVNVSSTKYNSKSAFESTIKEIAKFGYLRKGLEAILDAAKDKKSASKHDSIFNKPPSPLLENEYDEQSNILYTSSNSDDPVDIPTKSKQDLPPTGLPNRPHTQAQKLPLLRLQPTALQVMSAAQNDRIAAESMNLVASAELQGYDADTMSRFTTTNYSSGQNTARSTTSVGTISISSSDPFEQLQFASDGDSGEYHSSKSGSYQEEERVSSFSISRSMSTKVRELLGNDSIDSVVVSNNKDSDSEYSPITPDTPITPMATTNGSGSFHGFDTRSHSMNKRDNTRLPPISEAISPRFGSPRGSGVGVSDDDLPAVVVGMALQQPSGEKETSSKLLRTGSASASSSQPGWVDHDWNDVDSPFVRIGSTSSKLSINIHSSDSSTKSSGGSRPPSDRSAKLERQTSLYGSAFSYESDSGAERPEISPSHRISKRYSRSNSSTKNSILSTSTISYLADMRKSKDSDELRSVGSTGSSIGPSQLRSSLYAGSSLPADSSIREAAIQSLAREANLDNNNDALRTLSTFQNTSLLSLMAMSAFGTNQSITSPGSQSLSGKEIYAEYAYDDKGRTANNNRGSISRIARSPTSFADAANRNFSIAIPEVTADPGIISDRPEWDKILSLGPPLTPETPQTPPTPPESGSNKRISRSISEMSYKRPASPGPTPSAPMVPMVPLMRSVSCSGESSIARVNSTTSWRPRPISRTHSAILNIATLPIAYDKFHALIVDDVLSNRKLLSLLLKNKGVTSAMCEDGLEALNFICELPPLNKIDLIFMDNTMPRMTGIECCRALRQRGFNQIIIGLTGNSMEEELIEFGVAGADLVLTKPLRPKALTVILESLRGIGTTSQFTAGKKLSLGEDEMIWI